MNILYICHRIPYPPNKGDKIRSFNEIKYLSKRHKVFLAFLIDNKEDLIYVDELKKYCETVDYDVINPKWQKIKSLPYFFSRKPLTVPYFYSKKLQKAIGRRLSEIKFDVVFAFSSPMAEYVFKSKALDVRNDRDVQVVSNKRSDRTLQTSRSSVAIERAKRSNNSNFPLLVMDFVDVDSDKWRMYSEHSFFPKSLIYRNEWKRLMTYEKEVGEAFDTSLFVSDAEVELFKSFAPDVKAVSIPNGVDIEYFEDVRNVRDVQTSATIERAERSNNSNILFIGAMDYFPNEDAVLYFSAEIWPHVKKELPDARFFVVGGRPSRKVKILSGKAPDIVVTGYVPEVRAYLKMADVFVAPFRIARGIQNKVLEAMAAGLPVVARPEAVRGIKGCNGYVKVESSPLGFSKRIIKIVSDVKLRQMLTENALNFVIKNYKWEVNLAQLKKVITMRKEYELK